MFTEQDFKEREASPHEDSLIAQHFYQMWQDNDVSTHSIRSDWLNITLQFISHVRQELCYKAFVAEVDSIVVGSAGCQLNACLYPNVLEDHYRKYGYIWGVYVEPSCRGRGIGKQLTSMALEYLKSIGCTRVVLHASPSGKPVYSKLGFNETNVSALQPVLTSADIVLPLKRALEECRGWKLYKISILAKRVTFCTVAHFTPSFWAFPSAYWKLKNGMEYYARGWDLKELHEAKGKAN